MADGDISLRFTLPASGPATSATTLVLVGQTTATATGGTSVGTATQTQTGRPAQ